MSITDFAAKSAKPQEKSYSIRDSRGLYLRVDPSGAKYWILRYWEEGREYRRSLGPYPVLSVREAREKRDAIQNARARGERPEDRRKVPTFQKITEEWLAVRMKDKAAGYMKTVHLRLKKYILPALGSLPVDRITTGDVLRMCRKVERLGYVETAQRVKVLAGQVLRFALAAGWIEDDPTVALAGALQQPPRRHMATVTEPEQIAAIYNAMLGYPFPVMRAALLFSILTAARPGEVRRAEWQEIQGNVWLIPANKTKMRRPHVVPLSGRCRAVVESLRAITGAGRWLFPSGRSGGGCMSENGVRVALRGLGFGKEIITPHGFRAMFSTVANENGWDKDVIERQLAHEERNKVRGAYNHAEYLKERQALMQWWAVYLENLRSVTPAAQTFGQYLENRPACPPSPPPMLSGHGEHDDIIAEA